MWRGAWGLLTISYHSVKFEVQKCRYKIFPFVMWPCNQKFTWLWSLDLPTWSYYWWWCNDDKFFCSWYLFLLFLISCGPPGIWPHLISTKNVWSTCLSFLLIGRGKIQWSCRSTLYRCENRLGPLVSNWLWRQIRPTAYHHHNVWCLLFYM